MEIRVNDNSVEITGYVNAVGRESSPLRDMNGYFTETILPGAFGLALRENPEVPMFLNHDPQRVLAQGSNLDLREDAVGLHVRAIISDPDVVEKARTDRLRGWSFGFVPIDQKIEEREGSLRHRSVNRMHLMEVSLLDDSKRPAYPATSVYTRDDTQEEIEYRFIDDDSYLFQKEVSEDPPDLSHYRSIIEDLGTI